MYLHRTVLFLNVSHWKQDHHFMWSPEPACEGLRAIFAGQRQYLLIILIKDPKFDLALGFEPATSLALQSTSLPTEPNGQVKLLPNGSLYLSGKLPTYPSPKPT